MSARSRERARLSSRTGSAWRARPTPSQRRAGLASLASLALCKPARFHWPLAVPPVIAVLATQPRRRHTVSWLSTLVAARSFPIALQRVWPASQRQVRARPSGGARGQHRAGIQCVVRALARLDQRRPEFAEIAGGQACQAASRLAGSQVAG